MSAQRINASHSSSMVPAVPVTNCLEVDFDILVYTK